MLCFLRRIRSTCVEYTALSAEYAENLDGSCNVALNSNDSWPQRMIKNLLFRPMMHIYVVSGPTSQ